MKKSSYSERSLGFPLLYCCCSFDQTFCCYSEPREQGRTLTNLPPKVENQPEDNELHSKSGMPAWKQSNTLKTEQLQ